MQEILTLQITVFVVIASAFECHAQKKKKRNLILNFLMLVQKKFKPSKSGRCDVISDIVR